MTTPIPTPIQLTQDQECRDFPGRYTRLLERACGFLLTEDEINKLHNATDQDKEGMLKALKQAQALNLFFALVAGYPVTLRREDFEYVEGKVPSCAGELI